jgi:LysM repeat protein
VSDTATYARRITRYKVHKGDTVETVAENFGISAQMLRRWNGIHGDSLHGRKVLALHLPVSPGAAEVATSHTKSKSHAKATQTADLKPPATKSAQIEHIDRAETAPPIIVHHKVRAGETLYSIATYYKTTVAALKHNNREIAVLRPGMILIVPSAR